MKKLLVLGTVVACLLTAAPAYAQRIVLDRTSERTGPPAVNAYFVSADVDAPTAFYVRVRSDAATDVSLAWSVECSRGDKTREATADVVATTDFTREIALPFRGTPDACSVIVRASPHDGDIRLLLLGEF
jgi:hypothetical protein